MNNLTIHNQSRGTSGDTTPSLEESSVNKARSFMTSWNDEKPSIDQTYDNLENVREAFTRMSERVQRKWRNSVRGKGIITKADKYNIPYNEIVTDWLGLEDFIEEWEILLEEGQSRNVWWNPSEYDPIGLTQEIESNESETRKRDNEMWWYHMAAKI